MVDVSASLTRIKKEPKVLFLLRCYCFIYVSLPVSVPLPESIIFKKKEMTEVDTAFLFVSSAVGMTL